MVMASWEFAEDIAEDGREHIGLLFSGGFDSTTLLYYALQKGYRVTCFFIDSHQPQFYMERLKVVRTIERLQRDNAPVNVVYLCFGLCKTEDEYVPFRNLNYIAMALNYIAANFPRIATLWYGAIGGCGEDAYYDCSPEFVALINLLAQREYNLAVDAPFIYMDKEEVAKIANELMLHPEDTWSCNTPNELGKPCGTCKDCLVRQELYPSLYPKTE